MNQTITLRKIGGRFDACWRRSGMPNVRMTPGSGATGFGGLAALISGMLLPILLIALVAVTALLSARHGGLFGVASLATVPLVSSKRAAAELRAKAKAVRDELLDTSKELTQDEVKTKTDAIASLESRADAVAGFTPEADIEAQGGLPDGIRAAAPDGTVDATTQEAADNDPASKDFQAKYARHLKVMRSAFGGANGYMRALSQRARGLADFTAAQRKAHDAFQAFAQRSTIVGATGDASGGEFLLPLQQEHSIFRVPNTVNGMASIARRFAVAGRTLRIPYVVQSSATVTRPMAGIANVGYINENASITEAEPTFAQRLLTVYGVKAYSEIGDETLADDMTGQLTPALMDTVGQQVLNFIDEQATIDGNGTNQLSGAFNATANTALYSVTRNTANKVLSQDIFEMWTRCVKGPNTKWVVHNSVVPQLLALTLGSNALVSFIPNFQGAPTMMLLGIPVEVSPLMSVLGTAGDVAIGNGDFYALAIRNALSVESSIHFKFQNDVTAWRFITRAGGIPIPVATYSYKATGGTTKVYQVSPFVSLT